MAVRPRGDAFRIPDPLQFMQKPRLFWEDLPRRRQPFIQPGNRQSL